MRRMRWPSKSLKSTLTLVFCGVTLAAAGFFTGKTWPDQTGVLEITTTPRQAKLELSLVGDQVAGKAPPESTLMLNEQVIKPSEDFKVSIGESLPVKWWGDLWSVELNVPAGIIITEGVTAASDKVEINMPTTSQGSYVASKSGEKYHPATGCSYADRIKSENKIYFNTPQEAETAGYEPSSCIT